MNNNPINPNFLEFFIDNYFKVKTKDDLNWFIRECERCLLGSEDDRIREMLKSWDTTFLVNVENGAANNISLSKEDVKSSVQIMVKEAITFGNEAPQNKRLAKFAGLYNQNVTPEFFNESIKQNGFSDKLHSYGKFVMDYSKYNSDISNTAFKQNLEKEVNGTDPEFLKYVRENRIMINNGGVVEDTKFIVDELCKKTIVDVYDKIIGVKTTRGEEKESEDKLLYDLQLEIPINHTEIQIESFKTKLTTFKVHLTLPVKPNFMKSNFFKSISYAIHKAGKLIHRLVLDSNVDLINHYLIKMLPNIDYGAKPQNVSILELKDSEFMELEVFGRDLLKKLDPQIFFQYYIKEISSQIMARHITNKLVSYLKKDAFTTVFESRHPFLIVKENLIKEENIDFNNLINNINNFSITITFSDVIRWLQPGDFHPTNSSFLNGTFVYLYNLIEERKSEGYELTDGVIKIKNHIVEKKNGGKRAMLGKVRPVRVYKNHVKTRVLRTRELIVIKFHNDLPLDNKFSEKTKAVYNALLETIKISQYMYFLN